MLRNEQTTTKKKQQAATTVKRSYYGIRRPFRLFLGETGSLVLWRIHRHVVRRRRRRGGSFVSGKLIAEERLQIR